MRKWYQSLYWRIAIGFVLFLAAVLALQGGALLYLIARMEVAPGPPPPELTRLVARDLGEALTANPKIDIGEFFREEYEGRVPLAAIMKDGRVVTTDGSRPDARFVQEIRARMNVDPESFRARGGRGRGLAPRPQPAQPRLGQQALRRSGAAGVVMVDGVPAGVVIAMPRSALRQLGPTLAAVGIVLVVIGTAVAALFIFGPVRPRLRSLEEAARKVGAGDLTARAREDGGDEVAALAHAFNQMTHDLQQRAAQLQAADRARRLLLADVSHELMTPITGMRGYLETLSLHAASLDPDTRERYLAIIRDETQRVEHIVGDLLDLSRLEGGGDAFDVQDVPLEDVFGRVVARHGRAAEQKGVELATHVAPGAEIVSGDPMRLEQALQNLAANALRHTPRGGRVALDAAFEDGAIVVSVSDTGSGIPAEHLPHVFDRFYKVDPSRAGQTSGSGLGLSIVKAIVERHGGTVTAANRPGGGTVFTLNFPPERPINV
ncbi:MAG TPA: HAMP domain-containing sensor histidine kinase [Vicinamibacterales bacterium]|nr:HAMP domain-containing sensor histidine kinase [Vicinamibacterales bacterium]